MKKKNLKAIALTLVTALAITAMPVGTVTAEAASKPAQVKNLKKTTVTSNSITVKFKKVKNIKGYQIRVYNTKNKLVKSKTTKKTTYKITGLKASTKYKIKVRAYTVSNKKNVYGKNSKTLTVKTSATTVGKVKNLKSTDETHDSITLSWSKVKNATGYQVKVCTFDVVNNKYDIIKTKNTSKNTLTITGLYPSSVYTVTICAYVKVNNNTTYGDTSKTQVYTTNADLAKLYGVTPPGESTKTGAALKKEYEAWRDAWIKEYIADASDDIGNTAGIQQMISNTFSSKETIDPNKCKTLYDAYKYGKANGTREAEMLADFCTKLNMTAEAITPEELNEKVGYTMVTSSFTGCCIVKNKNGNQYNKNIIFIFSDSWSDGSQTEANVPDPVPENSDHLYK